MQVSGRALLHVLVPDDAAGEGSSLSEAPASVIAITGALILACVVLIIWLQFRTKPQSVNALRLSLGLQYPASCWSTFVWGEDSHLGATSSTIRDPLTGHAIHKLTYGPIEVSSQIGFERVSADEAGTYLNYTTTIVNGSDSMVSVRYGGIRIDGRAISLPWVILPGKKLNKRERKNKANVVEAERLQCFTSGFLSHDHLLSADGASEILKVSPKTALIVSSSPLFRRGLSPNRNDPSLSDCQQPRLRLCVAGPICNLLRQVTGTVSNLVWFADSQKARFEKLMVHPPRS